MTDNLPLVPASESIHEPSGTLLAASLGARADEGMTGPGKVLAPYITKDPRLTPL